MSEDDFMIDNEPLTPTQGPSAVGRYLVGEEPSSTIPLGRHATTSAAPSGTQNIQGQSAQGGAGKLDPNSPEAKAAQRAARLAEKIAAQRGEHLPPQKPEALGEELSQVASDPSFPVLNTPRISPMEAMHHRFPTALRGYRKEDVHHFLNQVSQQLENHLQERAELYQQIQELQQQIQNYRHAEDELRRTVVAAERISHELREQTKREANHILQEAEQKAQLITEQAATREREALITHDARMTELEGTFAARRSNLEQHYQQQEHALEARARERSAQLEREFSARYAELSGRLTNAHAEYANFMAQYRAVSQAFAQAANTQLLPENPALLTRESAVAARRPITTLQTDIQPMAALHPMPSEDGQVPSSVLIEDQRF